MDDMKKITKLLGKAEATLFEAPNVLLKLHEGQEERVTKYKRQKVRARGESKYKDTLGDTIGGPLHKAVSGEVTEKKLAEHADNLVKDGLKGMAGQLKSLGSGVSDADCDKLAEALVAQFGDVGSAFLKGDGKGIVDSVQESVNENPELVAGAAVLGTVAAVVANMEIPELAAKLGLAEGLSMEMSVQLGKIRDIALEKVKTQLTYVNKMIEASLSVAVDNPMGDARVTSVLDVRYRPDDKVSIYGRGTVSGVVGNSVTMGVDYQATKDLSIGLNAAVSEDDASVGVGVKWNF